MNTLFERTTGLLLLDPWLLAVGILVPLGLLIRWWRGKPAVRFAPGGFTEGLPRSWRSRLIRVPGTLQVLALLLAAFALARPVERVELPRENAGIDIMLCLDVSSSMTANDLDEDLTRLDLAKVAAARFVTERADDRIGLIRFARYPDLLCPLTLDHGALEQFLNDLDIVEADGEEDQTGIGSAVARAAQVIESSLARSKVVILLTDGEENVATARSPDEIGPVKAARLCERFGVRVYTIAAGIGKRDRNGEWVSLDTTQVRDLAESTGGRFYEARDATAVADVFAKIDELETVEFDDPRYELRERFLPFLLAAVGLLLVGRLLQSTVLEVLP